MTSNLLDVRGLKTYFPIRRGIFSRVAAHVRAVDDVSFSIAEGETLGLVGESGCGKTTAGRSVLRLVEPTAGTISYQGRDLRRLDEASLRPLRRDLQIVFQDPYGSLNPRMTVRGIIEEGLLVHKRGGRAERLAAVQETLRLVRLDPRAIHRYPHEFSGGQRQRISIARALVLRPKFMVLDEPISALDVSIQAQIINLLTELKDQLKLTYLFISHDLSVVEYLSDRVAVMYLGEIVETAESRALYQRPLHPYTHALLSSVPSVEPTKKRNRILLEGDVPSPIQMPSGCRFHPRCPLAMPVCTLEPPRELDLAGHKVRCHAVEQSLESGSGPADTERISRAIAAQMAAQPPAAK